MTSTRYSFRVPRVTHARHGRRRRRDARVQGHLRVRAAVRRTASASAPASTPVIDGIVGGWQVSAARTRIQSGRLFDLGNVRVVGMTRGRSAQPRSSMRKVAPTDHLHVAAGHHRQHDQGLQPRPAPATRRGAPSGRYFAPANGPDCIETINNDYGDCGVRTLRADRPQLFKQFDLSIVKEVKLQGRQNFQFRIDMLNALDLVNFTPNPASAARRSRITRSPAPPRAA